MEFASWLENQLNKRSWSQRELVRRSKMSGHKISQGQLSHIINGTREAGPEACIAIAYALGVPREEVFQARGWLLSKPEESFEPDIDPRSKQLAKGVSALPFGSREVTLDAMEAMLQSTRQLTSQIQQLSANGQHA